MRVMVVDDSPLFRAVMRDILVRVGIDDIIDAGNYEEAMAMYKRHGADIIFMDMVLPGKNGVDAVRTLKSENAEVKIIAMSSIANRQMILDAINSGAVDFIIKPTNEIVVNNIIQVWGMSS